ncbi:hypothetical protein LXA43DRAFT_1066091 [Ganoderma leucocontextum]|nr:hypothetical protein LXA43DRAFT_1066091 [Ganoderma leucocontextum]
MSHQTTMLLEHYQSTHNVVIVTEPWYGTIRAMGPDTKFAHAPKDRRVASPSPPYDPSPPPTPEPTSPAIREVIPTSQPDADTDIRTNMFAPVHITSSDVPPPAGDTDNHDAAPPAKWLRRKAPPDPKGNHLYGTQSHPNWTLLETERDARIAVYVNKQMVCATATIDSKIKSRDVALLRLRPDRTSDTINILGLYNDTQCTALEFLVDHINYLPAIHLCGGDYNLHGHDWDTVYPTTSTRHNLMLVDLLHGALGHRLLSPPDVVTHLPDNKHL